MDPWVIFDADNTLWEVESLYDAARNALANELATKGVTATEAIAVQQIIDEELHKTYGYSADRFPTSFERTLLHFFPTSSPAERLIIRSIAESVFSKPARAYHAIEQVVSTLGASYRMGILTAGENWVQESRLRQFAQLHHFAATEIVPRKDVDAFVSFADKNHVERRRSWVVGDSLRSDIIPAKAAGFNCILLRAHNWIRVEMESLAAPEGVRVVSDLKDVLSIIPVPAI